ncbi:DUF5000 domain-containing lipoprotein [Sphingobacterium pedocola]|uniref:DUF4959 domain-containing protein n=1 Tax=Sphingobacterium pedocola TaxID=2082722 RepID=A0ABR9T2V0_9SPHI|nr:DUF5000 domain-containing lipoprotein [Sphingobacterium pedocola]MBE8719673.1 hypothetical protein [Sphingobacterium pedocola]
MKSIIIYLFLTLIVLSFSGCAKKENLPISASTGKPGSVSDVSVKPMPGGAEVRFKMPDDNNILGVKAVYDRNGKEVSTFVSVYDNVIVLEGYDNQETQAARLITVNRALEESEPVAISFTPKKSPITSVKETVQIIPDFGGPRFQWRNVDRAPITFEMYAPDSTGVLRLSKIMVSSSEQMSHTIRGYPDEEIPVAIVLRDRYNNFTDTIYPAGGKTLTPLFEEKIPKGSMRMIVLNNDTDFNFHGGRVEYLIDDDWRTFGHSNNGTMPASFTVDMGQRVKMSRFVVTNREYWGHAFSWGNIKTFEVYGRVDAPSADGNWDEWTPLQTPKECEIIKPSGIGGTDVTPEDIAFGIAFDFEVPFEMQAFRYFRLKVTGTWSVTTFCHPAEVDFFGQGMGN